MLLLFHTDNITLKLSKSKLSNYDRITSYNVCYTKLLRVLSFAIVLLLPGEALAWGPGVHTAAARFVLANLDLVHPAAALIAQFPNTYLYVV